MSRVMVTKCWMFIQVEENIILNYLHQTYALFHHLSPFIEEDERRCFSFGFSLESTFRPPSVPSPSFCVSPSAGNCITGHSQERTGGAALVTPVSPGQGGGGRGEGGWGGVRGRRALGEAGQWSLCGTARYTLPLMVSDGAKVRTLESWIKNKQKFVFRYIYMLQLIWKVS